jgi:hypothetical protein
MNDEIGISRKQLKGALNRLFEFELERGSGGHRCLASLY